MRRMLTWLAGLAGVAALARFLRRKKTAPPIPAVEPGPDPAVELRRKLAETREDDDTEPAALDERRARVHERAHEAIDEMREPDEAPGGGGDAVA